MPPPPPSRNQGSRGHRRLLRISGSSRRGCKWRGDALYCCPCQRPQLQRVALRRGAAATPAVSFLPISRATVEISILRIRHHRCLALPIAGDEESVGKSSWPQRCRRYGNLRFAAADVTCIDRAAALALVLAGVAAGGHIDPTSASSGAGSFPLLHVSRPRRPNWRDHALAVVVMPQGTWQHRRYQVSSITLVSPAVAVLLCSSHVVVASCGNSRIMLSRGKEAVAFSIDQNNRTPHSSFLDIYCYF